jgi:phosphatidylserine/phosphatidylglycerophosphate/cardiolipin synthase-like enzyme
MRRHSFLFSLLIAIGALAGSSTPAAAQDHLCDPGNEDCRARLITLIRQEPVVGGAIDVAFWFMEDANYTNELIRRHQAGVKVRVLMDPDANSTYPLNAQRLAELRNAGIPMRRRLTSNILHWKMMLFRSQGVVEFSGANYSANAFEYGSTPYANYTDEAIFFARDPGIVNSFREKFDDFWTDTTSGSWQDYANIVPPLTRIQPDGTYPQDPQLNFPPEQNYRTRALSRYSAARTASNGKGVDVIMYRITDARHADAMIALEARGVPVRLYTEQEQYRLVDRMWHSWNVDRLYMAGVEIRDRAHAGLNHQKSVILHDQDSAPGDQPLVIFGSSNWTSPSANGQVEHNMFTSRSDLTSWFVDQFERKWNNLAALPETKPFTPLPPDRPILSAPANAATAVPTTAALELNWNGGPFAHLYDLYLDTNANPTTLFASHETDLNLRETPSKTQTSGFKYVIPAGTLQPGTTYYWKVVGKTMALMTRSSLVFSFTTAGTAPPPPTTGSAEIVLYASKPTLRVGSWLIENDSTAAGGARIRNPNGNAPKITTASADPASYFELTFYAQAGQGYHLLLRGKADGNNWANDSVFVQFTNSQTSNGTPAWRIGSASAAEVNLEDCSGCGLSGWGWQDNAYGNGAIPQLIYFSASGWQTLRVQPREDGLSIDQIVLSHTIYASTSPGSLKNDTTILAEADGTGAPPPPPPPPPPPATPEILLWAADAPVRVGWEVVADTSAAGGSRLWNPNANLPKVTTASATPGAYFEMTFNAEAGKGYRLWIRGKAELNNWANDSVFVQFSGSVASDTDNTPKWRIGTTFAAEMNLEECSGCGVSGWGWQDTGYGTNVLGPLVFFENTGPQTIRIQPREDGLSIDQIMLSDVTFATTRPGTAKNDTTIFNRTQ